MSTQSDQSVQDLMVAIINLVDAKVDYAIKNELLTHGVICWSRGEPSYDPVRDAESKLEKAFKYISWHLGAC